MVAVDGSLADETGHMSWSWMAVDDSVVPKDAPVVSLWFVWLSSFLMYDTYVALGWTGVRFLTKKVILRSVERLCTAFG